MIQEYALNFVSRTIYFLRGFLAIVIGLSITLVIAISSTERLPTLIFFCNRCINYYFIILPV